MQDSNIAICLLARSNSKRLPRKAYLEIQGKQTLWHLWNRLNQSDYPVYVCVPSDDNEIIDMMCAYGAKVFQGDVNNVLKRMIDFADQMQVYHVVRVTHDDLFIDTKIMARMVKYHMKSDNDYTYTALIPEGCGAEIYKVSALKRAYNKHKDVNIEGISNYFRNDDYKVDQYRPDYAYQYPQYRLTMDWPEDFTAISLICEQLPIYTNQINTLDIINFIKRTPSIRKINHMPKVSIYIPNYNYGEYLDIAITSALTQTFEDLEIIVIDDCSTDNSLQVLKKYIFPNGRVKVIFNEKNIGLPASANKAIEWCKGKYIMRIDADDMLLPFAVEKLVEAIDDDMGMIFGGYIECGKDMLVSDGVKKLPPYEVDKNTHHPTCCLINKRCWNDNMYNEKLSGLESYEFFQRFKDKFNVGFVQDVLWLKRDHEKGMMRNNLACREKLKADIDNGRA